MMRNVSGETKDKQGTAHKENAETLKLNAPKLKNKKKKHVFKKSKSKDDTAGITIIDFSINPGLTFTGLYETTEIPDPTIINDGAPQLQNIDDELLFRTNIATEKSHKHNERDENKGRTHHHQSVKVFNENDEKLETKAAVPQSTYRQLQENEESTTLDVFANVLSKLPKKNEVPKRIRVSSHSYKYDIVYEPHGQIPAPPDKRSYEDVYRRHKRRMAAKQPERVRKHSDNAEKMSTVNGGTRNRLRYARKAQPNTNSDTNVIPATEKVSGLFRFFPLLRKRGSKKSEEAALPAGRAYVTDGLTTIAAAESFLNSTNVNSGKTFSGPAKTLNDVDTFGPLNETAAAEKVEIQRLLKEDSLKRLATTGVVARRLTKEDRNKIYYDELYKVYDDDQGKSKPGIANLLNMDESNQLKVFDLTTDKNKVEKRDTSDDVYTAKDVAALEIIVDLMKNPNDVTYTSVSHSTSTTQQVAAAKINPKMNSIQVHIAIPYSFENDKLKRSLEPCKFKKVFSAHMNTPVDLVYQIHAFDENTENTDRIKNYYSRTTPSTPEDIFSPGMYLLVDSAKIPRGKFALKPVANNVIIREAKEYKSAPQPELVSPSVTPKDETSSTSNFGRVTLTKDYIVTLTNQKKQNSPKIISKRKIRQTKENDAEMRKSSWEEFKNYFGHQNTCKCRLRAGQTMCRSCVICEAVATRLIDDINSLTKYMTDHCTEIQTYFRMNPSGGRKLREAVKKIDKSLQDYYKRVRCKCQGRNCHTFCNYMDKRNIFSNDNNTGEPLTDGLIQIGKELDNADELNLISHKTFKINANAFINSAKDCISKLKNKREISHSENQPSKSITLDKISVNIFCSPRYKAEEPNTENIFSSLESLTNDNTELTSKTFLFDYNDDESKSTKRSGLLGRLFHLKTKKKMTTLSKTNRFINYFRKRETNKLQSKSNLITDSDYIWREYIYTLRPPIITKSTSRYPSITTTVKLVNSNTKPNYKKYDKKHHVRVAREKDYLKENSISHDSLSKEMKILSNMLQNLPHAEEEIINFMIDSTTPLHNTDTTEIKDKHKHKTKKPKAKCKKKKNHRKNLHKNHQKTTSNKSTHKSSNSNSTSLENNESLVNKTLDKTTETFTPKINKNVNKADTNVASNIDKVEKVKNLAENPTKETKVTEKTTLTSPIKKCTTTKSKSLLEKIKNFTMSIFNKMKFKSSSTTISPLPLYEDRMVRAVITDRYRNTIVADINMAKKTDPSIVIIEEYIDEGNITEPLEKRNRKSLKDLRKSIFLFKLRNDISGLKSDTDLTDDLSATYTSSDRTKPTIVESPLKKFLSGLEKPVPPALKDDQNMFYIKHVNVRKKCKDKDKDNELKGKGKKEAEAGDDKIISHERIKKKISANTFIRRKKGTDKVKDPRKAKASTNNEKGKNLCKETSTRGKSNNKPMSKDIALKIQDKFKNVTPKAKVEKDINTTKVTVEVTETRKKEKSSIPSLRTKGKRILTKLCEKSFYMITENTKLEKIMHKTAEGHVKTSLTEACDAGTGNCLCDIHATYSHILELQKTLPKAEFERSVNSLTCFKYKKPPKYFVLENSWRKMRRNGIKSDLGEMFPTNGLKWDWIRLKRSDNKERSAKRCISDIEKPAKINDNYDDHKILRVDNKRKENEYSKTYSTGKERISKHFVSENRRLDSKKKESLFKKYQSSKKTTSRNVKSDLEKKTNHTLKWDWIRKRRSAKFFQDDDIDDESNVQSSHNIEPGAKLNGGPVKPSRKNDDGLNTNSRKHLLSINPIREYENLDRDVNRERVDNGDELETDNGEYFEIYYKDADNVYKVRKKKRRKRRAGDLKELALDLKNLPPLKPASNELYATLGEDVIIPCLPTDSSLRRLDTNEPVTWKTDREDILRHGNVMIDGDNVTIRNVDYKNVGNYTCIKDNKQRAISLTLISTPQLNVVFTPMYSTADDCSYEDLKVFTQLAAVLSNEVSSCQSNAVRIEDPVCMRDKLDGTNHIMATAIMRPCDHPGFVCDLQCKRDVQCSLAFLAAANAPVLSSVEVLLIRNGVNKSLVPTKKNHRGLIITHALRKKDSNRVDYHKLSDGLYPSNVDIVVTCPAGNYLIPEQKICAVCPTDTYSVEGENVCYACPPGTWAAPGAAKCRVAIRLRRDDQWWSVHSWLLSGCVACGSIACALCAIVSHMASSRHDPVTGIESRWMLYRRGPKDCGTASQPQAQRKPMTPSRVILARFFKGSRSSSRGSVSQEKFERWKERNIPPPLPPIDFDLSSSRELQNSSCNES